MIPLGCLMHVWCCRTSLLSFAVLRSLKSRELWRLMTHTFHHFPFMLVPSDLPAFHHRAQSEPHVVASLLAVACNWRDCTGYSAVPTPCAVLHRPAVQHTPACHAMRHAGSQVFTVAMHASGKGRVCACQPVICCSRQLWPWGSIRFVALGGGLLCEYV